MITQLAVISGESLLDALIVLTVWGLILWILNWGLHKIAPPEPFLKVGTVILVVLTVIVLVNILLSFTGNEFISWRRR